MKVLLLDRNHPYIEESLIEMGADITLGYDWSISKVLEHISTFEGIVIRSRITLDRELLSHALQLKWIARVGAGLENIDVDFANSQGIILFSAPEGNRNAVGEHALGMLLALLNRLLWADREVREGIWKREENRGHELEGKTVGIIGYGNMGKSFAKVISGFDVKVLCHDLLSGLGDEFALQVSLQELKANADIISLHTPLTKDTRKMINKQFLDSFTKPIYIINTARGASLVTDDLVEAMESGKVLGACLDVLEYEKNSFEGLFNDNGAMPPSLKYLIESEKVILSPHIAGWTFESKCKMANTIVEKIKHYYSQRNT